MFATITIQTYNRSAMLAGTLESLRSLRCPKEADYEILIIDNNSSDNTSDVIKKYSELLTPRLRSIFEKQQGLSYARNRALKEAKGEIVCFLDDDVKVDPDWLKAVLDAFRKYNAAVVGGRSYLIYPDSRPKWLPLEAEGFLSRLDYGDNPLVNIDKELFGLNFSVSRKKALDAGGFDTCLGRRGKKLLCGEEKKLQDSIRKAGGILVYEPKALVGHVITPERLTKKWFFKRIFAGGISSQLILFNHDSGRISVSFIHLIRCWGRACKSMLTRHTTQEQMFMKQLYAIGSLGEFVGVIQKLLKKDKKQSA